MRVKQSSKHETFNTQHWVSVDSVLWDRQEFYGTNNTRPTDLTTKELLDRLFNMQASSYSSPEESALKDTIKRRFDIGIQSFRWS